MLNNNLPALEQLKNQYERIDQKFKEDIEKADDKVIYHWPGSPSQDIMLAVRKSFGLTEPFHTHDYFHFSYVYKGEVEMVGSDPDTTIKLKEGDLYAGLPRTGHAFKAHDDDETVVVGLLIQKSALYREFLDSISTDSNFFHFLIDHEEDFTPGKFMHLNLSENKTIRDLIRIMVREFVSPKKNTPELLKSLVMSFLLAVAHEYSVQYLQETNLVVQIIMYMNAHLETITLKETAQHFGYHPNYLTSLLKTEVGKSFSKILLELRMNRSLLLLKDSNLSINEIAKMVGYNKTSAFCSAFKGYYDKLPEDFREKEENE